MTKRKNGFYPIPDIGPDVQYPSVTHIQDILRKYQVEQWKADIGVDYLYDNAIGPLIEGDMSMEQFREIDMPKLVSDAKYYHKYVSGEAMDFGSRMHEALDIHAKTGAYPVDPELRPMFLKIVAWQEDVKLEVIDSELMVFSRTHRFAGTMDRLVTAFKATCPGHDYLGKRVKGIFDFKTYNGKDGKKPTIYPTWLQQIGAYVYAWEEMNGELLDFAGILPIPREPTDDDIHPRIYQRAELCQPIEEFIALANYFHITRRGKK